MKKKGISSILLFLLTVSLILTSISQTTAWSDDKITSSPGDEPTIDGIMDEPWDESTINQSYYTFSGDRRITLYVLHHSDTIYFLVEVKFATSQETETISIYLSASSDDSEEDFLDKKQITMENSTQKGNETSTATDLYRVDEDIYTADSEVDGFEGDAGIGDLNYRYYEFAIKLSPDDETQDNIFDFTEDYSIKVGINNTLTDEVQTDPIMIQIGPKSIEAEEEIGIFDFDTELYIRIVIGIILGIFGVFGILVLNQVFKLGGIKVDELPVDNMGKND